MWHGRRGHARRPHRQSRRSGQRTDKRTSLLRLPDRLPFSLPRRRLSAGHGAAGAARGAAQRAHAVSRAASANGCAGPREGRWAQHGGAGAGNGGRNDERIATGRGRRAPHVDIRTWCDEAYSRREAPLPPPPSRAASARVVCARRQTPRDVMVKRSGCEYPGLSAEAPMGRASSGTGASRIIYDEARAPNLPTLPTQQPWFLRKGALSAGVTPLPAMARARRRARVWRAWLSAAGTAHQPASTDLPAPLACPLFPK
eukprot:354926-Chlamydomonas_euryale.AAC.4